MPWANQSSVDKAVATIEASEGISSLKFQNETVSIPH